MSDDNNFFGLTDDEYQNFLEDIDQAVEEGNIKYGYGGRDVESEFQFHVKLKPRSKSRSKLRPQINYNRVRRKQSPMVKEFRK